MTLAAIVLIASAVVNGAAAWCNYQGARKLAQKAEQAEWRREHLSAVME